MSKLTFMKYLSLVYSKMVSKLKMLIIYWNLTYVIFRISRFWIWCQKLFLLDISHLFGRNWSRHWKYSGFIQKIVECKFYKKNLNAIIVSKLDAQLKIARLNIVLLHVKRNTAFLFVDLKEIMLRKITKVKTMCLKMKL